MVVKFHINEGLKEKSLNLLYVPYKCACNDGIIAEKASGTSSKPFNVEQIKQLSTLVYRTWFWDLSEYNIFNMNNGQVAIIDTELRGFSDRKSDRYFCLKKIRQLNMNADAKHYLEEEIKNELARKLIAKWFKKELREKGDGQLVELYEKSRRRNMFI